MFPDRAEDITFHRENAYRFLKEKNYQMARTSFMRWVESVRQQNITTNGGLERELEDAKKEYSEFVKTDPLYTKICDVILPMIKDHPNILKTELYKPFPQFNKN